MVRRRVDGFSTTEQRERYNAQAVEYSEVREFPGASRGARKTKEMAIRFMCLADAADEPNSDGFWMKLSQYISTKEPYIYPQKIRTFSRTGLLQRRR